MRNNKKHAISCKQMMCFLISSQIGFGIITLPSTLTAEVGHDGWISVLLSGFVCILFTYLITILLRRYSNKSIFQINIFLYGKYLGMFVNFIIFIYLVFISAILFRLFSEIIKITVLKLTPLAAISIIISVPEIYLCWKGLKVIARFTSALLITYFLTILFFIIIFKDGRLTFIMPIGNAGIKAIVNGMVLSGFSYLGIELLPIIYPYISDKKNVTKYALISSIFTTIFLTIIVFICTEYIGEWKLKMFSFPLFNIATSTRVPIIERLDLLFVMFWFPVMGSAIRNYFFCAYHFLDLILVIENKKYPIIIFIIIIALLGNIPKDLIDVFNFINIIGFSGMIVISILIFSLAFSFVNKRGVKIENSKNN